MKKYLFLFIVFLGLTVSMAFIYASKPESSLESFAGSLSFENNNVYLFLRGSNTKLGSFAKQYNKTDAFATHMAMGIMTDSLTLYHVNTESRNDQNLISESLDSFIANEDNNYLAIWKITDVSHIEIAKMIAKIEAFSSQKVMFDFKFNFHSDSKLYCSEFAYKVLNNVSSKRFELPMTIKETPKNHVFFLKKDSLTYYPADFFLDYKNIEEIDHWIK